jgi:hypothetical protein
LSNIPLSFSCFSSKTIFAKAAIEKIKPIIPRASILFPPFHCGVERGPAHAAAGGAGGASQGLALTRVRGLLKSGTSEAGNEYHLK